MCFHALKSYMPFPSLVRRCTFVMCAVVNAIVNDDPNQRVAALEQRVKACVQQEIQWCLRKFNVDLNDAVTAFKAVRVMCPVTVG